MNAEFTPTARDALTLYRVRLRQRDGAWRIYLIWASAPLVVFGIASIVLQFPFLAFVGLIAAIAGFVSPFLPEAWVYLSARRVQGRPVKIAFGAGGIEYREESTVIAQPWEVISRVQIDSRGVAFCSRDLGDFFVPARAFRDEDFVLPFQTLLSQFTGDAKVASKRIKQKTAQPGATDNPGDAQ